MSGSWWRSRGEQRSISRKGQNQRQGPLFRAWLTLGNAHKLVCCRKEKGVRDTGGGPSDSRDQAAANGRGQGATRGRRGRLGPGAGGRQADAAALAAAAASLNTFKGDGSFMDSFQEKAGKLPAQSV